MTYESFYGKYYDRLRAAEKMLLHMVSEFEKIGGGIDGESKVAYCKSRIKSPDSMTQKLRKRGIKVCAESAVKEVRDAVGIRIICSFSDGIYKIADWISQQNVIEVRKIKDYIAYPKENGYRSYHMILYLKPFDFCAEVQIRTIALDFWASLEHQMKYKHNIKNEKLIREELKRCADEIASVDLSMQTITDLIYTDS